MSDDGAERKGGREAEKRILSLFFFTDDEAESTRPDIPGPQEG